MTTNFFRALAVGTTAALVSLIAVPAIAAPTAPTSCAGVWVAVQYDDSTAPTLGCATTYDTGVKLLESAGFTAVTSDSAWGLSLDQIDAKPTIGDPYYWYQASAEIKADGSLGDWTAGAGIGADTPDPTKVSGFRLTSFSAAWPAPGPELTAVPVSASTSPSASTSATATPSASTSTAPSSAAGKAGKWLAASTPSSWGSAGSALDVGLGLATAECTYATKLKPIREYLRSQADDYSKTSSYAAAKLAIFASAVGDDPTNFAGVNLADRIRTGAGTDGQLGSASDFAFGQALAMIGLKRAGSAPSAKMVDYLLGKQLASGAWGFGTSADPDSTALALIALSDQVITPTADTAAAVTKATTWAAGAKKAAGYWANYSPVDSTSLLASALKLHGVSVADSLTWLGTQQLSNGAFANTLDGKSANQLATASAMFLLNGTSYASISAPLDTCAISDDTETDPGDTLANTGLASWPLGAAGVGLVALGAVLMLARNEHYQPKHAQARR
ncbi:hypothetical protein [Propionicimonas sp.]|uniref:hypothetical protein n=1 Tax=Propionicimonas sp. TaxID=1955623 RepID=UPI0018389283|nr:hypothetical protein [Propionicimonas sp.]MBU3976948.1 hypothetical protein [Actinomycetota bacterium]MBA3020519.1 hypothetical protein [Propionicimonas sp.]MBU3986693.1 hypothetical protein [Actinomycetota bacterium]MBU4007155.1 hypothetical protein [Actinomycetota bacterium]MBU4064908.1 hypothetical protein [Actinomycetota bacterium]